MPYTRDCYEESEDQDLQYQPTEDDVLACLEPRCIVGFDEHSCTATLDEEAEDVADNEDLGDPCRANDRV